ncbi:tripartite motif-containing protein 14-like isoform X1 [Pangasianodon hypophthalmus]|uniref:tripartite motif-containing protein 14-like isoform X1 n=1 Tax=Pangasianodon hypophthalmus TaxID=310915 RepID=UPI002307626E|nr:tripartite motif-containing protein 14-like isoform X1 [Pangasianodon hypophthalmus]
MISFMEKKRSEVTELIRAQEKAEVSRAERLLEQLEQEITDLKRRVTHIKRSGGKDGIKSVGLESWSLCCSSSSLSFYHNDIKTELKVPSSSRIGVYVDHSAGSLSFYSVSDTMKFFHRVHTTFTQPLYAGFRVLGNVRLCDPK